MLCLSAILNRWRIKIKYAISHLIICLANYIGISFHSNHIPLNTSTLCGATAYPESIQPSNQITRDFLAKLVSDFLASDSL